jgi:hypothetical protein
MVAADSAPEVIVPGDRRGRPPRMPRIAVLIAAGLLLAGSFMAVRAYTRNQRFRRADSLFEAGAYGEAKATYCTAFLLDRLDDQERRTVRLMLVKCSAELHDDAEAVNWMENFLAEYGRGLERDDIDALRQYLAERNCPKAAAVLERV